MKRQKQTWIGIAILLGCVILGISRIVEDRKSIEDGKGRIILALAEVHGEDYPTSMANQRFADLVKERTDGKIKIEIYNEGVLGEETEVIKKIQHGEIAFGRVSISPLAEYVDQLHVLMLPYLYKDSEHMWKVLESIIGDEMLQSLDDVGLMGLAWYDSGARSFYLTENVLGQDGLQAKKIRVQKNSLMYALCEALGAVPQTIPESEIYFSVLEGSIDGAENNILTYETYKQYEVCPYYILDEHTRIPDLLVGSKSILKKMNIEDQEIIRQAAKEAGQYQRILWQEREQEAISRLEQKGVAFIKLPELSRENLKKVSESLYKTFGSQYETIIREIETMGNFID